MENILVGLIVAAALFYCIKRLINTFKADSSCSCGCKGCPAGPEADSCSQPEKDCCCQKNDPDAGRSTIK